MKNNQAIAQPMLIQRIFHTALLSCLLALCAASARAQGTAFSYQGQLRTSGTPANGAHDFEFKLFDAVTGGTQLGANTLSNVTVTNGAFTVMLDFGAAFGGEARYLEISARQAGAGAFTLLTPRQLLTATPYALRSETATNALRLGGLPSTQYAQTNDARLTDERNPKAGSANYIQNTTTQQANSNFYISGNGRVGTSLLVGTSLSVGSTLTVGSNASVGGSLAVGGNLSKGGGSFKIDHPLDPENKYLYHSFVESPDMMNIYNGVVTLNESGKAEITLPDWFEALNSDFRYQLTAIGMPGPNLYVAEKVKGNRFKIAGGTPGMEVSWQVTGIRQDAFAKKNRIPVEELKRDDERGAYLHPEAFGQPKEKGLQARQQAATRHP